MEIKSVTSIEEAAVLTEIDRQCFMDSWKQKEWMDFLSMPQYHCYKAEEDSMIKGFLLVSSAADEGEIIKIAVCPEYRGRNVGSFMLSTAFSDWKSKGIRYLFLEVRESNSSARTLYEKQGFQKTGVRKNYYRYPMEHAIIYTKQLF